jgi:hypothetical protein
MKEHFLPFRYAETLYQRFHTLRLKGKSINDYTNDLYQLVAKNDLAYTKKQLVVRYLSGLRCDALIIVLDNFGGI